jgi:serine/threonine protein phosphatase PrpC
LWFKWQNVDKQIILMHRPEVTLYCANPLCQAPNPVSHRFCQTCRSPLTKQYLWLVGGQRGGYAAGSVIGDRYWCQQDRVFLDTKPALLPDFPEEVFPAIEPYLRLMGVQPHIPQVYAVVPTARAAAPEPFFLEKAPIYPAGVGKHDMSMAEGTLMPEISAVWKYASGLRQLNWLWQLTYLWQVCQGEGVTQSLLNPALLRVEGGLVRLLELQPNETDLSLVELGQLWQHWLPEAHPNMADFFNQLCHQLLTQQITTADHLMSVLDSAIAAASQSYHYQIQIATLTDQGPSRQRNEDACAPASGTVLTFNLGGGESSASPERPYVIVCDGIGGHEGGNIASNLAIETLQTQVQSFPHTPPVDVAELIRRLDAAAVAANNAITQRNDSEQRQERQRMGTTLVMALAQIPALYLTHVGDSRAYRLTPSGCHQITQDDDLATRETRLGYALYREALRQPSAGSLVQALGMNSSSLLRPTIQRYVLEDDCVFLLCSDGLSDNDRVEQFWQTYILPLLQGSTDIATVVQQLVAIANQQNGHDNATVGLLYCRVMPSLSASSAPLSATLAMQDPPAAAIAETQLPSATHRATARTQNLPEIKQVRAGRISPLVVLLAAIGLGGLVTAGLLYGFRALELAQRPNVIPASPSPVPSVPSLNPSPASSAATFTVGTRVLVNRSTPAGEGIPPIALHSNPTATPTRDRPNVPVGSVLEVISQQQDNQNQRWLGLKVCSVPSGGQPDQWAEPGERGWVSETAIAPFVTVNVSLTPAQLGQCASDRRGGSRE